MNDESDLPPLPHPTVDPNDINEAAVYGIMSNPVYVGVPPYPRIVSDEMWIRAAAGLIEDQGAEQFLVNMLHMLRISMVEAVPAEAIPDDYDGPWPGDDPGEDGISDDGDDDLMEALSPWNHPLEGYIYCSHDGLPMIILDDDFVCVAEYLNAHINHARITDLVTEPTLSLVFQNGHTLPLICPDCGDSLHMLDHSELLDEVNGLTVINMDWDDDIEALILEFGPPGSDEDGEDEAPYLEVHLDSVRQLTCPHINKWHEEMEDQNLNGH